MRYGELKYDNGCLMLIARSPGEASVCVGRYLTRWLCSRWAIRTVTQARLTPGTQSVQNRDMASPHVAIAPPRQIAA